MTVTTDLLSALRSGLVDVPLLIQSMQCELDSLSPNKTIYDMSAAEYQTYLQQYFAAHGWPEGSGDAVYGLYAAEIAQSRELGYQAWFSDYSFGCGNIAVAVAAGQGFASPVYLSRVTRGPDRPFQTFPLSEPSRYAGHLWDYIAAFACDGRCPVHSRAAAPRPGSTGACARLCRRTHPPLGMWPLVPRCSRSGPPLPPHTAWPRSACSR